MKYGGRGMITWKQKQNNEWVVVGPPDEVRVGTVTVTSKSGSEKEVEIINLGEPFVTDSGETLVYGYLQPNPTFTWGTATEKQYDAILHMLKIRRTDKNRQSAIKAEFNEYAQAGTLDKEIASRIINELSNMPVEELPDEPYFTRNVAGQWIIKGRPEQVIAGQTLTINTKGGKKVKVKIASVEVTPDGYAMGYPEHDDNDNDTETDDAA